MNEKGVTLDSKFFYYVSSKFAQEALYYPTSGGYYNVSTEYEINRFRHDHYLFLYVKSGKIEIKYENKEYIATKDCFIFLDCHEPHYYSALEESQIEWINFSGNASKAYFQLLASKGVFMYEIDTNWNIPDYLGRILTMMETKNLNEHTASILLHRIFAELCQISNETNDSLEEGLQKAITYMRNHYNEEINLDEIAKHAKLSTYHFCRVFKKQMNSSPYQFLINYRIAQSKKLLQDTNFSIQEIAYTCGFNSVSHFVTTFKKFNKLSPKKYRSIYYS